MRYSRTPSYGHTCVISPKCLLKIGVCLRMVITIVLMHGAAINCFFLRFNTFYPI